MKSKRSLFFIAGLVFFFSCNAPHNLETRIGSRRTETITATAKKEFDNWTVEMQLPVGNWTVKPNEDQLVEMLPGFPKSTLRWKVSPERWANREKPFFMELVSESGPPIQISVKYTQITSGDLVSLTIEILKFAQWF